jgi:hypothetical protein
MNSLWFLPAVLPAAPLFAVRRIRQAKNREFCAFSLSIFIFTILTSPCMEVSAPLDVLEGDLRLAEAA